MNTPHFSVVIPVYNAGAQIEATVASVLAQTERDFELILIDDGSTDDSLKRMRSMAEDDERIRVLSKANGGVTSARNLGMELARGERIAFLDADDFWHPEKLARHRAFHDSHPQVGCSFAQIAFIEAHADTLSSAKTLSTVPQGYLSLEQIMGENPVCTGSNIVVTRRCFDAIGGFRKGLNHAEDQEWLARVVSSDFAVAGIDALLVGYRMSPGGLSSDLAAMHRGWQVLADGYEGKFDRNHSEAVFCRYLTRRALRNGASPTLAMRFALMGMRCDAAAFLSDRRRGGLTLACAMASPVLPKPVRTRIFA